VADEASGEQKGTVIKAKGFSLCSKALEAIQFDTMKQQVDNFLAGGEENKISVDDVTI